MEITSIQWALNKAQLAEREKVALINANFKLNPFKKELAEQICFQNGTNLSGFLRECVDGLVRDYIGDKATDAIED